MAFGKELYAGQAGFAAGQGMAHRDRVAGLAIAAGICGSSILALEGNAQPPAERPASASQTAICVQCLGPDVTYRCEVKDSHRVERIRGSSRALEFVCITELAKAGNHQSCRAGSNFSGPCIGEPRLIDLSKSGDAVVIGGNPEGPPAAGGGVQAPEGAKTSERTGTRPDGPPQTLEELARVTVSKSKKQISEADEKMQEASGAVGKALKKSWACLSSLFTDCK